MIKMLFRKAIGLLCVLFIIHQQSAGQALIEGIVFDAQTHEPLAGAAVSVPNTSIGTLTNSQGSFALPASAGKILVSFVGYEKVERDVTGAKLRIALQPSVGNLQTVVITASREAGLRTEAPVAISRLSPTLINDTKPTGLYEIINKTPGVVMLNYNNEQHAMSIRQPMTTNAYFLYLEDGIPIRPMGVFNHNALIEMNVFAVSSVEIVKGPASSLYGPEAVGGAINFITQRPTAVPTARAGIQADNYGYRRFQYGTGATLGKLGVYIGGFFARQTNSWQARSDFDKASVNARLEYTLTDKTRLTGTIAYNNYFSQTGGNIDSEAFYSRNYPSTNDFTYRSVRAVRTRLSLERIWNSQAETTLTPYFRDNSVGQNPAYAIRWTPGSPTATGEINDNSFTSYGLLAQHSQKFGLMKSRLLAGGMYDYTTNPYNAYKIELAAQLRPDGRSVEQYSLTRQLPDAFLVRYDARMYNTAVFTQYDFEPLSRLRLSLGLRYDRMAFDYTNYLDNNATGSKAYSQLTPKAGLTYDLGKDKGLYANYSRGFSPPGLTAIFRYNPSAGPGEAPFYYNLTPAQFDNLEIGGWASFLQNKVYLDWAIYQMTGRNELLNVRQPDNSFDYQSAGKTLHRGIEYGITWKPTTTWFFRFGGTNALHKFVDFRLSQRQADAVQDADNKIMPQSPSWVANIEVIYKPHWLKGFRASVEWQRISRWYVNQVNTAAYEDRTAFGLSGVSVFHFRTGYTWHGAEIFVNVLNLTDELYANSATRGNNTTDQTTYTPAAPRTFTLGLQYNFADKK